MTARQLRTRIEHWQKRLAHLGIGHWRVEDVEIFDVLPHSPGANAAVWKSSSYDTCSFRFTVECCESPELDETIIHEWLHVAFRDLDAAIDSAETWFPAATWDEFDSRIDHEREGLIERLSRALADLD